MPYSFDLLPRATFTMAVMFRGSRLSLLVVVVAVLTTQVSVDAGFVGTLIYYVLSS